MNRKFRSHPVTAQEKSGHMAGLFSSQRKPCYMTALMCHPDFFPDFRRVTAFPVGTAGIFLALVKYFLV
jgi:hypothetical protein